MRNTYHLILICYLCIIPYITPEPEIRFVFEMFRHAARAPTDHLNDSLEDWFGFKWTGEKELTNVGLRQSYLTGYSNRQRYITQHKLLSEHFDPREVLLLSTDTHRTLLTANAHLQGLYPQGTGPVITDKQKHFAVPPNNMDSCQDEIASLANNALPNQMEMIPIHIFVNLERYIQLQDKRVCPGVTGYYEKTQSTDEMIALLQEIEDKFGENMTKVANGFSKGMFLEYSNAYSVLDAVICADVDDRDFSKFESNGISREDIVNYAYKFYERDFIITEEARNKVSEISMSPVFNQINEWMKAKIAYDKANKADYKGFDMPRLVMYSAHDSTMAVFNYFMEHNFQTELNYPTFASRIHLELMKNDPTKAAELLEDSDYHIDYYFNERLIKTITYPDFKSKISQVTKTNEEIKSFCRFEVEEFSIYSIFTIVFIIIAVSLLVGIVHILCKPRRKKYTMKSALNLIEEDKETEV